MSRVRFVAFALTLLLTACAGHSGAAGSLAPGNNPDVATSEEIQAAAESGVRTAYEFVLQRHRAWTVPQGSFGNVINVWMDGQLLGRLTSLRSLLLTNVSSMRHLSVSEAAQLPGNSNGAIVVTS
ncbi:MAG: hypothetical protein ACHQ9S_28080, partial [Candidatus Binatia bacterium]